MAKIYVFIALLTSFFTTLAQTYTKSGNPANPGGTCYCMTNEPAFNETAVWQNNNHYLADFQDGSSDLEWTTEIYLGTDDAGGHGIAFVFQQEGPIAGGNAGNPLGYGGPSGISPSVAIEIDTNENSWDPTSDDHMAVHYNGDHKTMVSASHTSLPNMEDGLYHELYIHWHYDNANPGKSTLTVAVDGAYRIIHQFDPASIFNASDIIYAGFTAGVNGVAHNEQKISFDSPGSAGSCSAATFPVEFLSVETVALQNQQVDVSWATASELNNDYFEVMRSVDANFWESIAQIDGAGTSDEINTYQFRDAVPFQGTVFYQIKQVDFNGSFSFSEVMEVEVGFEDPLQLVPFPNPASGTLNLAISSERPVVPNKYYIHHLTGKQVMEQSLKEVSSRSQNVQIDISTLTPGIYFVTVLSKKYKVSKQVVILP